LQSSNPTSCSYSAQFYACVCVAFSLAIVLVIPQVVHFPIGFANSNPWWFQVRLLAMGTITDESLFALLKPNVGYNSTHRTNDWIIYTSC